ncbi:tetratricopeptide repeat protein [Streptomyces tanashiensis]|uniref:tetratricopeptide repeat protein n=1 Tax=Streptomyces tanashiensis TaxID=67367 RepID=UPI0036E7C27F
MGAKKKAGKRKSGGTKDKRLGQRQWAGSSFAGASFHRSQVVGSGAQTNTINVQGYAAVPTAWNALPKLPQEFTGREDETAKILSLLEPEDGACAAVGSVAGLPGVGKTTLAHAVGHAALDKGWFTGVQLVNLRGYDPNPVPPQDALEALLRALGVAADHIPPTLDERAGLYRSQLDALAREGERFLILADNASSSEQIRPLLPARHHAVLVTSRHTLPGLGARLVNLHPLQPDAAVDLLRQRLEVADPDDRRVEDEPAAAEELAALCGYLPLALQIAAALLADDPYQPLSERVRMLTDAGSRLGGLDDGERNLRAVFDECLTRLTHQQVELYRLLGLHPGPDISTPAVAALTDKPADQITQLLRQLVQARLLIQNSQARDRWSMHDLLRVHAQEQARITMDGGRASRRRLEQARTRLADHYIRHAEAADTHLRSAGGPVSELFTSREHALAWFDAERENLLATTHTDLNTHRETARLGFALSRYLDWRRRLQDLLTVHVLALTACQVGGDTTNQAGAWSNLGSSLGSLRRYDEALEAHETALRLHQQTGDTRDQAIAWNNLGSTLGSLRRFDESLEAHETALRLHQQIDNASGQADSWDHLGNTLRDLRRYDESLEAHETALRLHQQTGDTRDQAIVWNNLASTLGSLRRYDESLEAHETSLRLHQQTGDTHGQAIVWNNLGNTLASLKRYGESLEAHETSLRLNQEASDHLGKATSWSHLGVIFAKVERYDEAVEAHQKSLRLFRQTGYIKGELSALNNLGIALAGLERYDEALEVHETALRYHEADDTLGQGIVWNNIGTACRGLGRHAEAIAAAEKAVAMLTQEADWGLVGEAWRELATTLSATGAAQSRIEEAWVQSATAYSRDGDHEAAATSRAHAESCAT